MTVNPAIFIRRQFKPGQSVYIDFPGDADMPWTAYEGTATLIKRYKRTWVGRGEHWLVRLPWPQKWKERNETFYPTHCIYPPITMTTTIPLPRYEVYRIGKGKATVRHMWYNPQGLRCFCYPVTCEGNSTHDAGEEAAICAVALAAHYGGIADTSRVTLSPRRAKGKRK